VTRGCGINHKYIKYTETEYRNIIRTSSKRFKCYKKSITNSKQWVTF